MDTANAVYDPNMKMMVSMTLGYVNMHKIKTWCAGTMTRPVPLTTICFVCLVQMASLCPMTKDSAGVVGGAGGAVVGLVAGGGVVREEGDQPLIMLLVRHQPRALSRVLRHSSSHPLPSPL